MNLDSVQTAHEAEDIITEDRIAAFGHLVVQAADILCVNHKYIVTALSGGLLFERGFLPLVVRYLRSLSAGIDEVADFKDVNLSLAYRGIECVDGLALVLFHQCGKHLVTQLYLPVLQTPRKHFLAFGRLLKFLLGKFLLNLGPRL